MRHLEPDSPGINEFRNDSSLKHKVGIVSGASAGIGNVIAEMLLEKGACLSATYHNHRRPVEELIGKYGESRIIGFSLDLLSHNYEAEIEKIAKATKEWQGKIDFLINVVGMWLVEPFLYEENQQIEQAWRLNYWSAYMFMKKTLPYLMEKGGQIINIASSAGVRSSGQQATYSASKAALISLTESTAEEFAPHKVRINAISPGFVNTSALDKYLDEESKQLLIKHIPLGRFCEPIDVANAVLNILLDDYMTGTNILLHGGRV
jgi:NAD(P)-dependent dehydrogenase (short-subunit alcohol dehydrogenase family)